MALTVAYKGLSFRLLLLLYTLAVLSQQEIIKYMYRRVGVAVGIGQLNTCVTNVELAELTETL